MKELHIDLKIEFCSLEELSDSDRSLVETACTMTTTSYAPYSHFQVGAAIRLKDGQVFRGSNQENAVFPVGLCAERTAFFAASASAPQTPPVCIAIAAQSKGVFTAHPVTPCGACRQALLEAETRFHQPIRVLLYGTEGIYIVPSIKSLLPLTFDGSELA
ncbi:MAG: cytidine deaminase [Bacteroidaceae bacterium]|nr:cytidine deaminase [Bacteroidaceae bacterium]